MKTFNKLSLTAIVLSALMIMQQCAEQPEPQTSSFHELMKLDQVDKILEVPGQDQLADQVYNILGVESEGRYFWFCDETWVKITDPCKQLTWLFGGEAYSFFPDVPSHTLQELCKEGVEQVCLHCPSKEVPDG